jgi:nucleoside-diphosphate-sugar epimerase
LAKGTAIVGNTPEAFNQIWNLPVDGEALTGREWAGLFAEAMKTSDEIQVLPAWGIKALGLFVPILREFYEMRYQYDREYYFDSSKFNSSFRYEPTANRRAVAQTVETLQGKASGYKGTPAMGQGQTGKHGTDK